MFGLEIIFLPINKNIGAIQTRPSMGYMLTKSVLLIANANSHFTKQWRIRTVLRSLE